jgi:hypothetical protein
LTLSDFLHKQWTTCVKENKLEVTTKEQNTFRVTHKISFIDFSIKRNQRMETKEKLAEFSGKLLVIIIIYGHRSSLCLFTVYKLNQKLFHSTPLWLSTFNLIVFNDWWVQERANGKENSCTFMAVKAKQCSSSVDYLLLLFLFNRFHREVLFPETFLLSGFCDIFKRR